MQVDLNRYGKMDNRKYELSLVSTAINIRCHHRCRSAIATAILLGMCICIAGTLGWLFWQLDAPRIVYESGGLRFVVSTGEISLRDGRGRGLMRGALGVPSTRYFTTSCGEGQTWDTRKLHRRVCEELCAGDLEQEATICGVYGRTSNISVRRINQSESSSDVTCHSVSWRSAGCQPRQEEDCYCFSPGYWYGGSTSQRVPDLRQAARDSPVPDPRDWSSRPPGKVASTSCSHEPYDREDAVTFSPWEDVYLLYSGGVAFYFPRARETSRPGVTVRFFSSNKHPNRFHKICFTPTGSDQYHQSTLELKYIIAHGETVKDVHSFMSKFYLNARSNIGKSEENILVDPIWRIPKTEGKSATDLTSIQQFQDSLTRYNFTTGLVIYEGSIWDAFMNSVSVKDIIPQAFVKSLWRLPGIAVIVHPFVALQSPMFHKLSNRGYFLTDDDGVPFLIKWHQKNSAILDFSNANALHWFIGRLRHLKNSVRSLSFSVTSTVTEIHQKLLQHRQQIDSIRIKRHFEAYITLLSVEASLMHGYTIIDIVPNFDVLYNENMNRTLFKMSSAGLGSIGVLEEGVRLGMLGYNSVLSPSYKHDHHFTCPATGQRSTPDVPLPAASHTTYLSSLLQASLLPGVVIPSPPWCLPHINLTTYVKQIIENRRTLHAELLTLPVYHTTPMPLWWVDPLDEVTFQIQHEVVYGDSLIVVSSLNETVDVYLPKGIWFDVINNREMKGKFFYRMKTKNLFGKLIYFKKL